MDAIDKFDYTITKKRAKNLLRKLNWELREEDALVEDMVQNAALELIRQNDLTRFNFIIKNALISTVIEWRFQVPASSHKNRIYKGTVDKEIKYEHLDLSNFDIFQHSLDTERVAMSRECIGKLISGKIGLESGDSKLDIKKRKDVCMDLLNNNFQNVPDKKNKNYRAKFFNKIKKLSKEMIKEHI